MPHPGQFVDLVIDGHRVPGRIDFLDIKLQRELLVELSSDLRAMQRENLEMRRTISFIHELDRLGDLHKPKPVSFWEHLLNE